MAVDPKSSYYDAGGVETIDIIRAKLSVPMFIGYLLGNIIKYSSRFVHKGDPIRDAEKIKVYAELLHTYTGESYDSFYQNTG